jgi:hypothetical protein
MKSEKVAEKTLRAKLTIGEKFSASFFDKYQISWIDFVSIHSSIFVDWTPRTWRYFFF